MKQKDIAVILIVVFFSAIFSYFVSSAIFVSPKDRKQKVEVVQPITSDFPKPDERFFNSSAFDPTQTIIIGENANTDPFASQ